MVVNQNAHLNRPVKSKCIFPRRGDWDVTFERPKSLAASYKLCKRSRHSSHGNPIEAIRKVRAAMSVCFVRPQRRWESAQKPAKFLRRASVPVPAYTDRNNNNNTWPWRAPGPDTSAIAQKTLDLDVDYHTEKIAQHVTALSLLMNRDYVCVSKEDFCSTWDAGTLTYTVQLRESATGGGKCGRVIVDEYATDGYTLHCYCYRPETTRVELCYCDDHCACRLSTYSQEYQ